MNVKGFMPGLLPKGVEIIDHQSGGSGALLRAVLAVAERRKARWWRSGSGAR